MKKHVRKLQIMFPMTPVVKSLFTDLAMEITSDAMQIHGGYGYAKIKE